MHIVHACTTCTEERVGQPIVVGKREEGNGAGVWQLTLTKQTHLEILQIYDGAVAYLFANTDSYRPFVASTLLWLMLYGPTAFSILHLLIYFLGARTLYIKQSL